MVRESKKRGEIKRSRNAGSTDEALIAQQTQTLQIQSLLDGHCTLSAPHQSSSCTRPSRTPLSTWPYVATSFTTGKPYTGSYVKGYL